MLGRRTSRRNSLWREGALLLSGALIAALLILPPAAQAANDDEDSHAGLLARYTAGEMSIERFDPDVQFIWGANSADPRLPAGSFSARWTGKLLIRSEGKHAFHLYMQGEATISLNGTTVVSGRRDTPGWIEGAPTPLEFGEHNVEIAYRKTAEHAAIRLFWSSESFPIEPIAPQLFFYEIRRPDLDLIEHGGELYHAHRCDACHRREHESPHEPAPALDRVAISLKGDWLIDWLVDPQRTTPHSRMPRFAFSRDDARAVAAYFFAQSTDDTLEKMSRPAENQNTVRRGEILFRTTGCLACHTRGDEGIAKFHGGGDLSHVGRKRTGDWLFHWLKEPAKLNPDHRMPVFKLTDDERQCLASYLLEPPRPTVSSAPAPSGRSSREQPGPTKHDGTDKATELKALRGVRGEGLPAAGKKIIETARCASCHRIDGFNANIASIATLEKPVADWSKACTDAGDDQAHQRPNYRLTEDERRAIRAYIESRNGALSPESPFVLGKKLLSQKGCLACHERNGGKGISESAGATARLDADLAGQSESLVPPDLTAAGDKLLDHVLAAAIAGNQKTIRLPWLRVRMPRFEHQPAETASLLSYLIGHDRIPDGAPPSPRPSEPSSATGSKRVPEIPQSEMRRAGVVLAGTRGFSCTACHKIAGYEPRGVGLVTRGSDLYLMSERMRPEFFMRWTRSPLRIIPGMEMPSFDRPVAGILEGQIDRQLAALWQGLNDKSGPPKIDTSTIEQVLTIAPGEPAKIIRDVFNVGDSLSRKFVPRAFAIGLDNGVSVLFDLDTMSVQRCWSGKFAQQRSEGKSWYWEGPLPSKTAPLMSSPDILLQKADDREARHAAAKNAGRYGKLRGYEHAAASTSRGHDATGMGVRLEYDLNFQLTTGPTKVAVTEHFFPGAVTHTLKAPDGSDLPPELDLNPDAPDPDGSQTCIRQTTVRGIPEGYQAVQRLTMPSSDTVLRELATDPKTRTARGELSYSASKSEFAVAMPVPVSWDIEPVSTVPGYDGVRLPLSSSIMPTAFAWLPDGTLAFCSLKGQVYLAKDTDGDGLEDRLTIFEEGLAAPYGLIADGNDLIVAHKPELLRLRDADGDGRADVRSIVADGWGYTEDYHDWTCGIVRDSLGNLFVGTGSDYARPGRDREKSLWRGKVLRIARDGTVTPMGHGFRYPTGLAITPDDQIFVSDNQGVQNTFNEINHLVEGASYGVPALYEHPQAAATPPAIQVPHPWTRSVNGIFFLPDDRLTLENRHGPLAGHGIGCEYDNRFLVRFTLERVGNTFQGAVYPFSLPAQANARAGFLGTLCGAVSPRGDIYIGSIHDSGWLGGTNVGDVVRLRPNGKLPIGIREIRAAAGKFVITFTGPVDNAAAARRESYEIAGYTRQWQGAYATPDSGRHVLEIQSVDVSPDGRSVVVHTSRPHEGCVYEITCGKIGPAAQHSLWPNIGHYTFNRLPEAER